MRFFVKGDFLCMDMNKVRIRIGGMDYSLTTDDEIEYIRSLGDEVDELMTSIMREHSRLSMTQAAVLCALQFADEKNKIANATVSLRNEIQAYMEDASKAKTDAEVARREVDRLNKELHALKNETSRYRYE